MGRVLEDLGGRALLDDLAEVHDRDAVGHLAHGLEIVAYQQVAEVALALDAAQQTEDLPADGDVERGGGLVEQQDAGFDGQCPGDADALPLAAAELAGVTVKELVVKPDIREEPPDPRFSVARLSPECRRSGSSMIALVVMRGLSEELGSWNTIWMSR